MSDTWQSRGLALGSQGSIAKKGQATMALQGFMCSPRVHLHLNVTLLAETQTIHFATCIVEVASGQLGGVLAYPSIVSLY